MSNTENRTSTDTIPAIGTAITVKDILTETKRILSETNWIKHAPARNADDLWVDELSSRACKFCLSGALTRAAYNLGHSNSQEMWLAYGRIEYIIKRKHIDIYDKFMPIAAFNDFVGTTWQDVLDVLTTAIEEAPPN